MTPREREAQLRHLRELICLMHNGVRRHRELRRLRFLSAQLSPEERGTPLRVIDGILDDHTDDLLHLSHLILEIERDLDLVNSSQLTDFLPE